MPEQYSIEPDPLDIDPNYAESAANVRARFRVYEYCYPFVDVEAKMLDTLKHLGKLTNESSVMDIGTADAVLFDRLKFDYDFDGIFWGIDPNTKQFTDYKQLGFSLSDWEGLARASLRLPIDVELIKSMQIAGVAPGQFFDNVRLQDGRAHNLDAFEDNSVDLLFAMFMLYHVPRGQRKLALQSFRRVVKPEGIVAVATSGENNKDMHRELESKIGETLGIQPPPAMNSGFTTEKARLELPKYFAHCYFYDYISEIQIDSQQALGDYLGSLSSLRDQFKPVPAETDYRNAVERAILPKLEKAIHEDGAFIDHAHRTLALMSEEPLPELVDRGFVLVSETD